VPAEIKPPELARIVDFAERPRTDDWSLRAALVRYAQPEPQRASDILEVVRRVEFALAKQTKALEHGGQALWEALNADDESPLVGLLRAARELDALGDVLVKWAIDYRKPRPDNKVDNIVRSVAQRLDELGVPREERVPGSRNRG
jgi:hypothetical protein